jgi:colanic acid/amylovoran biosynthesis protein
MMGARMHANIGALSSGIPTIAIAYSHKTPGIMGALSQSDLVLDIDKLDRHQIEEKMDHLFQEEISIGGVLQSEVEKIKKSARQNVEKIRNILS